MPSISNKILFTGGGSAGHVTPNLALIRRFQEAGWETMYIGSYTGIEKELITNNDNNLKSIPYFPISTGKLRRYFSWRNFIDPCKILFGTLQAIYLCRKLKPNVIFSKGGFVSFPVVVAGWLCRIPVFIHESDPTPGLANKLSFPFATKICLTIADTTKYIKNKTKIIVTGTPIRKELLEGNAELGRKICGFNTNKKIILVFGGSLGAEIINDAIRKLLPQLSSQYQIAHIGGAGNIADDIAYAKLPEYKQFTYLQQEFPHVMAAANMVISRAGANTVHELMALHKPHILIPLAKGTSRGDQIDNAKYLAQYGASQIITEEALTPEILLEKIHWIDEHEAEIVATMQKIAISNGTEAIYQAISDYLKKHAQLTHPL
jgi:UDP-N-acetylglucosamine--N-acetylmuramyl-(pentapeptide) pyrophosphoryl-undecaprenol N-acetylglucosamine transferase